MIRFFTQIIETPNVNEWWTINQLDFLYFFLMDEIKNDYESRMTMKNLGTVLIKTLNLLNYRYPKCFAFNNYMDLLHDIFTIPGQNVSLPDIAYIYSIMDFSQLNKEATFKKESVTESYAENWYKTWNSQRKYWQNSEPPQRCYVLCCL